MTAIEEQAILTRTVESFLDDCLDSDELASRFNRRDRDEQYKADAMELIREMIADRVKQRIDELLEDWEWVECAASNLIDSLE